MTTGQLFRPYLESRDVKGAGWLDAATGPCMP